MTKTVRKGIADASCFEDNPSLLMWGMLCVLFSVGIWLMLATHLSMPVSTTHSCVGGIVGMAVVLKGADCVTWYEYKDDSDDSDYDEGGRKRRRGRRGGGAAGGSAKDKKPPFVEALLGAPYLPISARCPISPHLC